MKGRRRRTEPCCVPGPSSFSHALCITALLQYIETGKVHFIFDVQKILNAKNPRNELGRNMKEVYK